MITYSDHSIKFMRHDLYALYKCLYLWEYMAFTGSGNKSNFYDKRRVSVEAGGWECPCCENGWHESNLSFPSASHSKRLNLRCNKCLLNGYAWKAERGDYIHCLNPDATFRIWDDAEDKRKRIRYAGKMVKAIKKAIHDLEMKNLRYR